MLSPLLELYFAKSNAVSPLCGETGSGEGCWTMRGGAVTTQAPLTPAPPTLRSYPYPPTPSPAPHAPTTSPQRYTMAHLVPQARVGPRLDERLRATCVLVGHGPM